MRRVASLTVLLVMASVASLASVPAPAARAQAKDRITSAADLPVAVKSLSPRNAAQPTSVQPAITPDPMPFITEFYGPAKSAAQPAKAPALKRARQAAPEASIPANRPSAQ